MDGEIPNRKKKTEKDSEKVLQEPAPVQPQKKRRSEKSSAQVGVFLEENYNCLKILGVAVKGQKSTTFCQ